MMRLGVLFLKCSVLLTGLAPAQETAEARAARMSGVKEVKAMSLGYSTPDRKNASNAYLGATSRGHGWEIRWKGPYNNGPTAIEAVLAAIDHLKHLQSTTSTSESNAKLLVHLIKAAEEFDGSSPTIGGELNSLIPKPEEIP